MNTKERLDMVLALTFLPGRLILWKLLMCVRLANMRVGISKDIFWSVWPIVGRMSLPIMSVEKRYQKVTPFLRPEHMHISWMVNINCYIDYPFRLANSSYWLNYLLLYNVTHYSFSLTTVICKWDITINFQMPLWLLCPSFCHMVDWMQMKNV